jgi:hypothetical protein
MNRKPRGDQNWMGGSQMAENRIAQESDAA